ncbi:MAG: hypothetical protein JWM28_1806 [Chitinophagaceae bacterium]|nr:hypothetical protein [Chitinophagaceae bacterium]
MKKIFVSEIMTGPIKLLFPHLVAFSFPRFAEELIFQCLTIYYFSIK